MTIKIKYLLFFRYMKISWSKITPKKIFPHFKIVFSAFFEFSIFWNAQVDTCV